jgi:hypothetical protein
VRINLRLLTIAIAVFAGISLAMVPSAGAASSPLVDPAAKGTVTLCNQRGQVITSGSTTDTPMAWKIIGSEPAPTPFNVAGSLATTYIFIPQQGVPASMWTGDFITSASKYDNMAYPASQATSLDFSLNDFLSNYHPLWDGLLQLRLIYSRAQYGEIDAPYASTTIRVSGKRWTVVGAAGSTPCASVSTVSNEIAAKNLPISGIAPSPDTSASGKGTGAGSLPSDKSTASPQKSGGTGVTNSGSSASPGSPGNLANSAGDQSSGGIGLGAIVLMFAVTISAVVGIASWLVRRRA